MTDETTGVPDYDDAAEARIHAYVEEVTGGRIVRIERQVRWRPAWFADVEKDGAILHLHLRGDRAGDVAIFPDLKREADIIRILHDHGVPVPRIYGYLADPPCIVMESIEGTRDLSDLPEETKSSVGRDYMAAVAAMHRVPLAPLVAEAGIHLPQGAEDIALVGLRAYLPQYHRIKRRPEPLIEFVIGWLRRNVPQHRTRAAFIQFDSGQFLVHEGRMTKLYDFEFSMIGDPLTDLATMGMRNSYEPLGPPLAELVLHYEEATGEPVDHAAVLFHVLQFSVLGTMQFTGTVAEPRPGDPHAVYLQFDLALRRSILLALSELAGVHLPELPPLPEARGGNAALIAKLGRYRRRHYPCHAAGRGAESAGRRVDRVGLAGGYGGRGGGGARSGRCLGLSRPRVCRMDGSGAGAGGARPDGRAGGGYRIDRLAREDRGAASAGVRPDFDRRRRAACGAAADAVR